MKEFVVNWVWVKGQVFGVRGLTYRGQGSLIFASPYVRVQHTSEATYAQA